MLLLELERFQSDLAEEVGGYAEAGDELVEGLVFTLNTSREHALLQRLLSTEAETVLLFLTVEGDDVIRTASYVLAPQLAVALHDDYRTQLGCLRLPRVIVQVVVSAVLTP
ncbi:hypothetical protein MI149_08910 [Mycolicibacterium crocinum]|uniref:Uncharacterized protein n=1 Tax=Mycolicibacterium crocinum TaxID=388459 RepID=A0ABY3TQD6_9MYCO|nr:hypothetical protein [Mycolicibacterium crocinum]ULN43165.1 hypothetical protein MI149_08910 [Mycolicibacterium crocinum]